VCVCVCPSLVLLFCVLICVNTDKSQSVHSHTHTHTHTHWLIYLCKWVDYNECAEHKPLRDFSSVSLVFSLQHNYQEINSFIINPQFTHTHIQCWLTPSDPVPCTSDNTRAMMNHDDTLEVLYRSVKNWKCYEYGYWSKLLFVFLNHWLFLV